jgi:membrane fusion protein, heavy metal efflux system
MPVHSIDASPTQANEISVARRSLRMAGFFAVLTVVVAAGLWLGGFLGPQMAPAEAQSKEPIAAGVEIVKDLPHTLAVSEEVRKTLGILRGGKEQIEIAKKPASGRSLDIPGSTALNPSTIVRVRARFAPAEVVQVMKVQEPSPTGGNTTWREVRSGDHIRKGDVLGIFYSVDVGNKKNDLIDALLSLHLHKGLLQRGEEAVAAVPDILLMNARNLVQSDENAVSRAISTLKTWNVPENDIQAVRDQAEAIIKNQGKRDKVKESDWARVELKAPADGVLVERNVALHEVVVDGTTNLFVLADVDHLNVIANVPEDDLPALEALTPAQRRWLVKTVGSKPIPGAIDDIGVMIDPNQHTAVVKGHIDNPNEILRSGQFISATIELPPPKDVVEIPISAIVEDGKQCLIFVQPDPAKANFTMRRVVLVSRLDRTAWVRSQLSAGQSSLTDTEKEDGSYLPPEPLKPGERVLTTGVMELKAALEDKESSGPSNR